MEWLMAYRVMVLTEGEIPVTVAIDDMDAIPVTQCIDADVLTTEEGTTNG